MVVETSGSAQKVMLIRFDGFTFVSIQNGSHFDIHVKSFRRAYEVDSIQTEVSSIKAVFT